VPLPAGLQEDLHSNSVPTRVEAVQDLVTWLGGAHIGRVLAAAEALREVVASDDSLRVRTTAQQALDAHPPAFDRPDSSTPEKITVLTPSGRPDAVPDREPAPVPPVSPVQRPHGDVRAAWMAWALTESRGNQAVAADGVEAALAAAGAGRDAAADAARRAMASAASAPHIAPQPAGTGAAPSRQPPVQPAPPWTPQAAAPLARPPEAMISLVLGILSLVMCFIGIVLGPLAIWYGRRARQRVRESAGQLGGAGLGTAGIWLGAVGVGVPVVWIIYTVINAAMHSSGY
jgi:hypothetical protein